MKNKILHPAIITVNLALLLMLGFGFSMQDNGPAVAAENDQAIVGENEIVEVPDENPCIQGLKQYNELRFKQYQDWMEEHFRSKAGTSELLETAVAQYNQYKIDIDLERDKFAKPPYVSTGSDVFSQSKILSTCNNMAEEFKIDAAQLLELRAATMSEIKEASAYLEKYKQINAKMKVLNLRVLKMITNITTFEQKLPCYLTKCVGK